MCSCCMIIHLSICRFSRGEYQHVVIRDLKLEQVTDYSLYIALKSSGQGQGTEVITVKSRNFVIFSHKTFFFTKFREGTPYFFSSSKFIKKWFRCWHGNFLSWLTCKPLFFYHSSSDEITFVSPIYSWTKIPI